MRGLRLLAFVAAAIPPVLVSVAVARWGVNVPLVDQWVFAPAVADAARGQLDFHYVWGQHDGGYAGWSSPCSPSR
jgi:hypothetical protein